MYSAKDNLQLTDLPETVIVQIAEQLPVTDLPSLLGSCRTLAAMAPVIYSERKVLDMSCFELVTFQLCLHLIERFSHAHLVKCKFCYGVISGHQINYDDEIVLDILERFLDNFYPRNCKLLADLYSAVESEASVGFRPIDILAHCYLLDKLLDSQECLKELELDVEFSVLKVPGRRDWPLMRPFIALDIIQKACPQLEIYRPHEIRYQAPEVNYQHLQVRFLKSCNNLKIIGVTFLLNTYELELFDQLLDPLPLERAWFFLQQWQVSKEKRLQNCQRLEKLASKMTSLKSVGIVFKSRGSLSCFKDFVRNLPCVESLKFLCGNFGEGVQNSHLFSDAFSILPQSARKLCLGAVPQEDFHVLFQMNGPIPQTIKALTVQFDWNDNQLSEEQEKTLTKFLADSHHLEEYYIEGHTVSNNTIFAVSSGIKSRNLKQCLTSLHEDFIRYGLLF